VGLNLSVCLGVCEQLGPHPEERAPKSGLPDFGNQKVSKSATADFDARVSKDGREQPKSAVADFDTFGC